MNRTATQFAVAVIGMFSLAAVSIMVVAGSIWGDVPSELSFMIIGALISATSTSAAWLFRLNGTNATH